MKATIEWTDGGSKKKLIPIFWRPKKENQKILLAFKAGAEMCRLPNGKKTGARLCGLEGKVASISGVSNMSSKSPTLVLLFFWRTAHYCVNVPKYNHYSVKVQSKSCSEILAPLQCTMCASFDILIYANC